VKASEIDGLGQNLLKIFDTTNELSDKDYYEILEKLDLKPRVEYLND